MRARAGTGAGLALRRDAGQMEPDDPEPSNDNWTMIRLIRLPLLSLLLVAGGCTMISVERPPERDAAVRLEQGLASLQAGLFSEAFDDLVWVYSRCAGHEASYQALAGLAALELDPRNRVGREAVGSELLARLVTHPGPPTWTRPLAEASYLMALALGAPPQAGSGGVQSATDTAGASAGRPPAAADRGEGTDSTAVAGSVTVADSGMVASSRAPGEPAGAPLAEEGTLADGAARAIPIPSAQEDEGPVYGCGGRVQSEGWAPPGLPTLPGPSLVTLLARAEAESARRAARSDSLASALDSARRELEQTRAELERIRKTLTP